MEVWTISRLVQRLEGLKARHCDCPVFIEDADTEWHLPIVDKVVMEGDSVRFEKDRILLRSNYVTEAKL